MPVFHRTDEAGGNRIVFDIADGFIEFAGVADPAVEGFVAPEGPTGKPEDPIGFSRRRAFQPAGDNRERFVWGDQKMDVVWHDYPGVELVEASFGFSFPGCCCCEFGYADVHQPLNTVSIPMQHSVFGHEGFARREDQIPCAQRHRSVEAPGEKNLCSLGVDMGESSSVVPHRLVRAGGNACLTVVRELAGNSQ
jgi:hypothetical protein